MSFTNVSWTTMDFPSIVSSTSDLRLSTQMLHSSDINLTEKPVTPFPAPPSRDQHPPRGMIHVAVITAFILPFTVLPYMLARRQISTLRRQLAETQTSVKVLEQELNLSWQEMTNRKEDTQKLRGTLWKLLQERDQEKTLSERKKLEDSKFQSEVKIELQKLLKDSQAARSQGAILSSLGTSLADVAAFMHEIELEMGMLSSRGKDQRGIDRLRSLARQMQATEARFEPKKLEESEKDRDPVDEVDPYYYGQADDVSWSSGTTVAPITDLPQLPEPFDDNKELSSSTRIGDTSGDTSCQEQALESHEVIELQTFSERKVWIEEKIKFLEKLPPIKVFAGLDAVRTSAEHVPGVPTSGELKQWIVEHDAIEKETEIFDRGELTKLRQLTKAATQRNLSPADTDVIELTLTTIYELDKLLHLLRDRSENLELLTIRLNWEESRIAAWIDRRKILEDVQTFLDTRVRWTPAVYENASIRGDETPGPKRRGSIASFASATSDASATSAGFSRGARFKLAELLSHDAAQFAGRVTGLRHGKITAAGKILDKLIDHSRKPVPEELLDEQDKLEEQGITDMENLGKFVLNMVVQWRKADEIYVETMKDKTTAQNLFEEIETAKLHHPSARQTSSFVSRADALIKRLSLRGNPVSSTSSFPSPEHHLFSDQINSNQMLAQLLSSEISAASAVARNVDSAAKAYRAGFEAVKRVEDLIATANELSDTFSGILSQLQEGISTAEGDGSPPDFSSTLCLDHKHRHSAFLTVFPLIVQRFDHTSETSSKTLRHSMAAMFGLDHPGVDAEFVNNARSAFKSLELVHDQARAACEDMKTRCGQLQEARRLHAAVHGTSGSLKDVQSRVILAVNTQQWRPVTGPSAELPATTSLVSPPVGMAYDDLTNELIKIKSRMRREVDDPIRLLCETLDDPMKLWFLQHSSELKGLVADITNQLNLLASVQRQAAAMKAIHDDFTHLQLAIENSSNQFNARTQDVLGDVLVNGSIPEADINLQANLETMQDKVAQYVNSLSDRVPFVSQDHNSASASVTDGDSDGIVKSFDVEFNLPALDAAVRADSNSFAMTLSIQVEDLSRQLSRFHLAGIAKEVDSVLIPTTITIRELVEKLQMAKTTFAEVASRAEDITLPLDNLLQEVDKAMRHDTLQSSFSQMQSSLQQMGAVSEGLDASAIEPLYTARQNAVDDAIALHKGWERDITEFLGDIRQRQSIEAERIAEEQQAERDRAAVEAAKRRQAEQEKVERETLERLEEERISEALRQKAEDQRRAAEEIEAERIAEEQAAKHRALVEEAERLRTEQETLERLEKERISEALRQQVEDQRRAVEKARLEQLRLQAEESRRLEDKRLDEERLAQTEQDRLAAEKAKEILPMTQCMEAHAEETRMELKRIEVEESQRREVQRIAMEGRIEEEEEDMTEGPNKIRQQSEGSEDESRLFENEQSAEETRQIEKASLLGLEEVHSMRLDPDLFEALQTRSLEAPEERQRSMLLEDLDTKAQLATASIEGAPLLAGQPLLEIRPPADEKGIVHKDHRPPQELETNAERQRSERHRSAVSGPMRNVGVEAGGVDSTGRRRVQHQTGEESRRKQSPEVQRKLKHDRSASTAKSAAEPKTRPLIEEDVFGLRITHAESSSKTKEIHDLQAQILAFRTRLRSLNINDIARPKKPSAQLPDLSQSKKMSREFSNISSGVSLLPRSATDPAVDVELRSLRTEIEGSVELIKRVETLAHLVEDIQKCDAALSDLLEHIDSYPASPKGVLSSSHRPLLETTPEEQLTARLNFTRTAIENMTSRFSGVSTDPRAIAENSRILQTWSELEDMGQDRLGGRKSRSASTISSRTSSGRNSSASIVRTRAAVGKKAGAYSNLSVSSVAAHRQLLLPRHPTPRRIVSDGTAESQSRPVSQLSSLSSNRAVSGPLGMSVYGSTFASRQRTSSLSNSHSTPTRPSSIAPIRSRAQTAQDPRVASPTGSEASSHSRSIRSHTRSSTSMSTWSRAPRNSLSSIAPALRSTTPKKRGVAPRKTYVADPKNKLDVAVGDVVNQLPVGIKIEGVSETWKDQSGKYWIGNQDPKLCFCRILRSQTVMVRVGGGWSELSK
ncbi:hypothetical protein DXG01_007987 [Tephrocybe rancida]|nr:hypothetical protein DXG01_007987 [Tephrocybe rancida]